MEQVVNLLAAAGVIPTWAWILLIVVAIPLFFAWHTVSLGWPPHEEWDAEKGKGTVKLQLDMPEGGATLHQQTPKEWS